MLTLKVIAGEKTEKNLWGKGKGDCWEKTEKNLLGKREGNCWEKTEKNLLGKPVIIYNEINTLCSGAT